MCNKNVPARKYPCVGECQVGRIRLSDASPAPSGAAIRASICSPRRAARPRHSISTTCIIPEGYLREIPVGGAVRFTGRPVGQYAPNATLLICRAPRPEKPRARARGGAGRGGAAQRGRRPPARALPRRRRQNHRK